MAPNTCLSTHDRDLCSRTTDRRKHGRKELFQVEIAALTRFAKLHGLKKFVSKHSKLGLLSSNLWQKSMGLRARQIRPTGYRLWNQGRDCVHGRSIMKLNQKRDLEKEIRRKKKKREFKWAVGEESK